MRSVVSIANPAGWARWCALVVCSLSLCVVGCGSSKPERKVKVDRERIERAFDELEGDGASDKERRDQPRRSRRASAKEDTGPEPVWTRSRPTDTSYYHGIGSSPESVEQARARALGDLATKIQVQIVSVVESIVQEEGRSGPAGSNSVFSSRDSWQVELLANQTVSDPEWVDTWSGGGRHSAYVRIPRAQVKDRLRKQLDDARDLALDHFVAGERAKRGGKPGQALKSYLRGLGALREYLGQPVTARAGGRQVVLNSELVRAADQVLAALDLKVVGSTKRRARPGNPVQPPLEVVVEYDGRPVKDLPIRFAFEEKVKGDLVSPVRTDRRGKAASRVHRVNTVARTNIVEAGIDLAALSVGDAKPDPGLEQYLSILGGEQVQFLISTSQQRMFLSVDETNLGQVVRDSYLSRMAKSVIADSAGMSFVADRNAADLVLEGTASTRFSSRMGAVVFCYADVTMRLIERSGEELYSTRRVGVKGADRTKYDAAMRALEKASDEVLADLLRYIEAEVGP